MQSFDVNKALYLNCEIHVPWFRVLVSRVVAIWSFSENFRKKKLRKSFSTPIRKFVESE